MQHALEGTKTDYEYIHEELRKQLATQSEMSKEVEAGKAAFQAQFLRMFHVSNMFKPVMLPQLLSIFLLLPICAIPHVVSQSLSQLLDSSLQTMLASMKLEMQTRVQQIIQNRFQKCSDEVSAKLCAQPHRRLCATNLSD